MTDHITPTNIDAEAKMLGAMILDPNSTIHHIRAIVQPGHIWERGNRIIFKAILELTDKGGSPDELSIINAIGEKNLSKAGGAAYITGLQNQVSTSANAVNHAQIVLSKFRSRAIMDACQRVQKNLAEGIEPDQALHHLRGDIDIVQHLGVQHNVIESMRDVTEQEVKRLMELYDGGGTEAAQGITTGFDMLDEYMGGFKPGDLIFIAARTGSGKSHFANYMLGSAMMSGEKVGLISLDMGRHRLLPYLMPMLSTLCGEVRTKYDIYKPYQWAEFQQAQMLDVAAAMDPERNFSIVCNPPAKSMAAIYSYIGNMVDTGHRVICIDQLADIKEFNEAAAIKSYGLMEKVIVDLKNIPRQFDITLLVEHQIGRAGADRPKLVDLKYCGGIEDHADFVILLHDEQNALKQSVGGWVQGSAPHLYRAPRENSKEEANVECFNPRYITMDLAKTRGSATTMNYIPFDFRYGVKVRYDEDSGQFMKPEPTQ